MLFNGRALIFTFSGTQVRIAEIERLQSLFKMSMAPLDRFSSVARSGVQRPASPGMQCCHLLYTCQLQKVDISIDVHDGVHRILVVIYFVNWLISTMYFSTSILPRRNLAYPDNHTQLDWSGVQCLWTKL